MLDTVSKKALLDSLEHMPDKLNLDELLDRIMLLAKIERGIRDSEEGKVVPHEDVKKMVDKWFE